MSMFNNIGSIADKGTDASKEFVSKSYEYSKLKIFQLSVLTVSTIAKLFVIGGLAFLGFIFLVISGAIALGDYLGNIALGYLLIGIGILFISLVLYFCSKYFDKKIIVKMSKMFFDKTMKI